MLHVTYSMLVNVIEEVCDQASSSPYDFKEQAIEDVLAKHKIIKIPEARMYTVEELCLHAEGTVFQHPTLGKGEITKKSKQTIMNFGTLSYVCAKTNQSLLCSLPMICLGKEDE